MATTKEPEKHFKFNILNIKLRRRESQLDLDAADYIRIFKKAHRLKIHKEASPNKHCIFKFIFEERENNDVYLAGTFAHFTFINNEKWFNLESMDIDEEFRVPNGLFPDAKIADFVFIPKAHRFCYKVNSDFSISPYTIKKFLEKALDEATETNEYVQVDVETDRATIDIIKNAREIRKLIIDVNYSNFDIGDDFKKFVEEDIKASDSSQLRIEATQKPQMSIKIENSKILTGALESSVSNGEAEATIIDEHNNIKHIKTTDFPKTEKVFGTTSRFPALVYRKIMDLFRPNGGN